MQGMLLDGDYVALDGGAGVRLFLKGGKIAVDDSFSPYFYVLPEAGVDSKRLISKITKSVGVELKARVEQRGLLGVEREVLRLELRHPQDVPRIREVVREIEGVAETYEDDILFVRRYLIDRDLTPTALVEFTGKKEDSVIRLDRLSSIEGKVPKLNVFAFDIEVYAPKGAPRGEKDPITMMSLASNTGLKKVITWKTMENPPEYFEFVKNEKEVIERFLVLVRQEEADVLIGYNTDQFDFPYLMSRCKELGIELTLGVDGSEVSIDTRMGITKSRVKGRPHVDLYPIVRRSVRLSSYVLENVVRDILGIEKEKLSSEAMLDGWEKGGDAFRKLVKYSMEDASVTLELGEKFLPLYVELSRLVKQPLFDVARMSTGQLVEWLLIREAFRRSELVPNRVGGKEFVERARDTYAGGYVREPVKGLSEDIVVFDFRSLYPSIIVTHNIDPTTFVPHGKENKPPDFDYGFSMEKQGFIPDILGTILEQRTAAKVRMKEASGVEKTMLNFQQNALKILANSFYGYMGYPRARWYKRECAESVASFARKYIKDVMKVAEEKFGFRVVYGDTDSLFMVVPTGKRDDVIRFQREINRDLPGTIELELEGFYKRGIFVTKKRYALIDEEGAMTIKGLEFVRRDWAPITRKTQQRVLEALLKDASPEKAAEIVKGVISDLRERKVSLEEVTLYTQLTKNLRSYKNRGPHVIAAEKMQERGREVNPGMRIGYIIKKGTKMISERAEPVEDCTLEDYDVEYYIQNQILPSVSRIMEAIGYSKSYLTEGVEQESLEKWF